MKKKILSSICIILLILSLGLVNQVSAVSNTSNANKSKIKQISLINSPAISFNNDKEKLADVKINIKDPNKVANVKIYHAITENNKTTNVDITDKCNLKKESEKSYICTISHKEILKGGKEFFLIEATNEKGYYIKMEFSIGKVTNSETKKTYYGINRAPPITQMKIENNKFSFRAIEYWGMKNLTFRDLNNNSEEVFKKENINKGAKDY